MNLHHSECIWILSTCEFDKFSLLFVLNSTDILYCIVFGCTFVVLMLMYCELRVFVIYNLSMILTWYIRCNMNLTCSMSQVSRLVEWINQNNSTSITVIYGINTTFTVQVPNFVCSTVASKYSTVKAQFKSALRQCWNTHSYSAEEFLMFKITNNQIISSI